MTERTEIARAVEVLRAGGLVAFPTETVYGLGADARNPGALRRLYAVKGRPASHPVIVHLAAAATLGEWAAEIPSPARRLASRCWPGPLTLVLRRSALVPDEATGGRDTVGVRVPDQPLALELLGAFGGGVAAPSANRFGRVSPTTAAHVRSDLGADVDLVLDGGPCRVGVESTVVDCTGPLRVLRPGAVPTEVVERLVGRPVPVAADPGSAPGTLPSHYSPRARVVLVPADEVDARAQALRAEGRRVGVLDAPPDAGEYARVLYGRLRDADRRGLDVLLAVPPEEVGIGAAVADRLRRAAAGRREEEP